MSKTKSVDGSRGCDGYRIGVSPGARQRHAAKALTAISSLRDAVDRLERDVIRFRDDGSVVNAALVGYVMSDLATVIYRVGEANGAIVLPDLAEPVGRPKRAKDEGR